LENKPVLVSNCNRVIVYFVLSVTKAGSSLIEAPHISVRQGLAKIVFCHWLAKEKSQSKVF